MKKTMPAGIVLVVMLAAATAVAAAETNVSLGLKVWTNTWKETIRPEGAASRDLDNGSVLMAGPSLSVRFSKDWFADITYLTPKGDYESANWYASGDKMKFARKDLDAAAGYLLNDPLNDVKVGFYAAYKTISAQASYTNLAAGFNDIDVGTWKLWGPGFGVLVEKPLDKSTSLYGNLGYLFLEQEFAFSSGTVSRFHTGGWTFEIALAHVFTKAISANVGVKFQRFKGEKGNGDDVTDSFSGITGGLAYSF